MVYIVNDEFVKNMYMDKCLYVLPIDMSIGRGYLIILGLTLVLSGTIIVTGSSASGPEAMRHTKALGSIPLNSMAC